LLSTSFVIKLHTSTHIVVVGVLITVIVMEWRVFLPILQVDDDFVREGEYDELYNDYIRLLLLMFPLLSSSSSSSSSSIPSILNLLPSYSATSNLFSSLSSSLPHSIEVRMDKYILVDPNSIPHHGIKIRNYNSNTKKAKCEVKIKYNNDNNDINIEAYTKYELGSTYYTITIAIIIVIIIMKI